MSGRTRTQRFRLRRDSVAAARRYVEVTLGEWMLRGLVETVALVVSELATNAVVHAKGIGEFFELTLRRRDAVLVVEVSDSCRWRMPELVKPEPDDAAGRGLLVVDAVAQTWGVRPRAEGKTVWAHLSLRGDGGGSV
ncbi:ATP-binding protein [Streptomyces sp. NPDC041068]|uniref:ATP-binding protein n=1 Tax=Streptomyces sp. NPDC041068 TaxID=3155130 RepID=UPI0033EF07B9